MTVAHANKEEWGFAMDDIEQFSTQVAKRVIIMRRHVRQAKVRKIRPKWPVPL